ncbi:MAG: PorV/PorQ family protein, partial [Candidatus Krumholzibacteriia bacterium]
MLERFGKTIAAVLLSIAVAGWPGAAAAKKFAGEFMASGGGARALGMGGAFAAVASDASALFWNPAGISGFEKRQALFMHSERFGNLVNYNFAAFTSPTTAFMSAEREASFGVAVIHLGVDDIAVTNNLPILDNNGVPGFQPEAGDRLDTSSIPRESNNDFALFTSYAMKTAHGRVGGTLKLIYTDAIGGFTATGVGLDLGFLRRNLFFERFDVGVKLQDITGTYISWSTGTNEFIAPSVKLGLAYSLSSPALNGALLLTADGDFYFEDRRRASQFWVDRYSLDLHFGTELQFQGKVMIRGGFDAGEEHNMNPTAGAGFRVGALGFDYAYLQHDDFESTHRV